MQRALESIDAAADCGADAAKFQSLNLNEQWFEPTPEISELHRRIDLDESWYTSLKQKCDERGLIFLSSPTYFRAVELLEELGVCLYKIASAQVGTFPQLVQRVAETGKPILFSTGIVTSVQVSQTVAMLRSHGAGELILLHCNSIYPTPPESVNLSLMNEYQQRFDLIAGFSDHTDGIVIPIAAVARGAKVIEKHFLLDRKVDSPDAPFSLLPDEFGQMVDGIRRVEKSLRPLSREALDPLEANFKNAITNRLILCKAKSPGVAFDISDFEFRRHADGIDSVEVDKVLERFLPATNLEPGQLLKWEHLKEREDVNKQECVGHRS